MQKINVDFDNQIFNIQKFGGISRYFVEIFKEFNSIPEIHWGLKGVFSRNIYLNNSFPNLGKIKADKWNFKESNRLINLVNKLSFFLTAIGRKPDLYHFTYYQEFYFNRLNKSVPRVVTVYDMIDEIFEGNSKTISSKKSVVTQADLVIAISHSTAADIQRFYSVATEKILVTHLASSLYPAGFNDSTLPARFILFVGLRQWYKNFDGLLVALQPLLLSDAELTIVCAGGGKFTLEEMAMIDVLQLTRKIIWKPINSDEQLACYYEQALFFVFPSKYEGFGIPVLEAMNCNCPVVLSKTSSLVEVAGNAGYYFDPESKESIFDACKEVLYSKDIRNTLIEKGKVQREIFSWRKTAEATILAYQKVLHV